MVDVGRGPNVRPSMPMLLPERWDEPRWHMDARVLHGWMVEAALHGAAGITIWPWSFLGVDNRPGDRSTSAQRIETCRGAIETLRRSGIFEMAPRNSIAVIYEPYAEGWGAMSEVYGLMRYPDEEPITLMHQLRYGTRYGQVDYLTGQDLANADLDGYGSILAQFTPELSPNDLGRLAAYVARGGALFADVGFDCMRAGKSVTGMSEEARRLFGIRSLQPSAAGPGRWVATGAHSKLLGGLASGTDATERLFQYALDVQPAGAEAALKGPGGQGLYVHPVGRGYAIYCSALAWSRWTVADPLFRKVHNALFALRAGIERLGEDDWELGAAQQSLAPGYELARFTSGYAIQNRCGSPLALSVRVGPQEHRHELPAHCVLLCRGGTVIDLGTGSWPFERGTTFTLVLPTCESPVPGRNS
jgi:hypothetical protein